jgi:hypothetical protein
MKNQVKNLLMFTAIAGSLTIFSCRETKEDNPSENMQHEMQDGEHMDDENMMDDSMMDDNNMNEDNMEDKETTSEVQN